MSPTNMMPSPLSTTSTWDSCDNAQTPQEQHGFTCFGKLPGELRDTIWSLAIPEGRAIEAITRFTIKELLYSNEGANIHTNPTPVPALLHTCQESRDLASKTYHLIFANAKLGRPIYFAIDRDTLVISGDGGSHHLFEEQDGDIESSTPNTIGIATIMEKVRFLAIKSDLDRHWLAVLSQFRDLRSITFQASGRLEMRLVGVNGSLQITRLPADAFEVNLREDWEKRLFSSAKAKIKYIGREEFGKFFLKASKDCYRRRPLHPLH